MKTENKPNSQKSFLFRLFSNVNILLKFKMTWSKFLYQLYKWFFDTSSF